MPRRSILSESERASLIALPESKDELIRHYTFDDADLSLIRQHRGAANRLGFAIHLCYMRFPGIVLGVDESPFPALLRLVAEQLKVPVESWDEYSNRAETRREHLLELQSVFNYQPFTTSQHYRSSVKGLDDIAWQTDKGTVLGAALVQSMRRQRILLPSLNVIERVCSEAITRANRRIYTVLTSLLLPEHTQRLDALLTTGKVGQHVWLG